MTACLARFCAHHVEAPKAFCDGHWALLPMEIKERVADSYKAPLHDGRQPNPEWATATTQAIGWIGQRTV